LNNGIVNLRTDLNNLNVKASNMVNKDEFNSRLMEMNTRNATLQTGLKELQQANATILALRERSALLEQQGRPSMPTSATWHARCNGCASSWRLSKRGRPESSGRPQESPNRPQVPPRDRTASQATHRGL
jgi:hypothetical protein